MLFTLNLDHQDALNAEAANYSTPTLRVSPDFPISITRDGRIVSVHRDDMWDLTPYALRITRLHFATITGIHGQSIDRANIDLFKHVMVWVLYALGSRTALTTVKGLYEAYKSVARLCVDNGIAASDLHRYPQVYRQLAQRVSPCQWRPTTSLLHRLYRDRDLLGFIVLDYNQIHEIGKLVPKYVSGQTAYIPERIHYYVIDRCAEIVEAYLASQDRVDSLYRTCVDAALRVREEFGADVNLGNVRRMPGNGKTRYIGALEHCTGKRLQQLAADHGVLELILDLIEPGNRELRVRDLSGYLSHVTLAARILIAALSAMRDKEHGALRVNCYETREDPLLGTVCLLKGRTTKTQQDAAAYWVTSSLAGRAVACALSIANLRADAAEASPKFNTEDVDRDAGNLFGRITDPWTGGIAYNEAATINAEVTVSRIALNRLEQHSKLFDPRQLTLTQEDLAQALRLTPELDPEKFFVGAVWPLAWHQFRRTLVCLALGSGVSLASMAWQLKHAGPAMTQHYGNNYFRIQMDPTLRKEFERTQIEMLLVQGMELTGDDYVPTTGGKKEIVIRLITQSDEKALEKAARDGNLAFKRTALGVCTNPEPCPFGGWEHIAECLGCGNALACRKNKQRIERMIEIVEADLAECGANDTLLRDSLVAQHRAAQEALRVIG
jgi:hypothetical protein